MLTYTEHAPKLPQIELHKKHIMKVIVKKWGNSAAVRIPASAMVAAHIALDQTVEVREEQGRIVIEPVRRKVYKLEELLGCITAKNLRKPIDTGASVGEEAW